ncbi:HEAT repeat domain-containing protein [Clostridium felsineum]|uniref:HEAT repeat domain-containing protein n=1 Tax=Clostridium felsineum TaxID=36839 RepID=UPI0009CA8E8A|nr:HEAT repeat domain-containing protein [Clostridium felsineum]URZ15670.1 hypothetical protein CLFE_017160 [Clostridium felsineum DSM 794]
MENKDLEIKLEGKSSFEKIDMIEQLEGSIHFTPKIYKFLEYLSEDDEYEVRVKVAEILVLSNDVEGDNILIKLLKDKEELVRVNACDSLCTSFSKDVIYHLKDKLLKDKSNLVKGYAILSLVDIFTRQDSNLGEHIEFFKQVLKKQETQWVRINIYKALYMLGDKVYLDMLVQELGNRYYRNRCAVVNILSEIASKGNYRIIEKALAERLKIEKSFAVKGGIEELLSEINNVKERV